MSPRGILQRLQLLDQLFDLNSILFKKQPGSIVQEYYRSNLWAYLAFHNKAGYIHMGLSDKSKVDPSDFLKQVKTVENHITSSTSTLLELGSGYGSNSRYLAQKYPNILFKMVDLSLSPKKPLRNMRFSYGNFEDLQHIRSNSIDIVFGIETVCHAHNKGKVLKEIHRVLKPGGKAILFDGYFAKQPETLSNNQFLAGKLIEYGMAVEHFSTIRSFNQMIKKSQLKIIESIDLSQKVLPTMKKLEHSTQTFFRIPALTKLLLKILPNIVARNALAGYLLHILTDTGVTRYYQHTLLKPVQKKSS